MVAVSNLEASSASVLGKPEGSSFVRTVSICEKRNLVWASFAPEVALPNQLIKGIEIAETSSKMPMIDNPGSGNGIR